eukprot:g29902.t1
MGSCSGPENCRIWLIITGKQQRWEGLAFEAMDLMVVGPLGLQQCDWTPHRQSVFPYRPLFNCEASFGVNASFLDRFEHLLALARQRHLSSPCRLCWVLCHSKHLARLVQRLPPGDEGRMAEENELMRKPASGRSGTNPYGSQGDAETGSLARWSEALPGQSMCPRRQ